MRIEVKCFVTETELALCIKLRNGGERWVPISVCNKIMRKPMELPLMGTGKCGYVEVEDWFARKEGLIDE